MKGFWKSSIGKKIIVSLSGIFLMLFLLVHLTVNLALIVDSTGITYNLAANFMSTNPFVKVMEPILAVGFLLHIIYTIIVQIQNWIARGSSRYEIFDQNKSSTWSSRNMIWLGIFIFGFLILHLINFTFKVKFGHIPTVRIDGVDVKDLYTLVSSLFELWWYDVIYLISFVALGLHLRHAFWSAFQTIGLSNKKWLSRLKVMALVYTLVVSVGFSIIPIYFLIFKN